MKTNILQYKNICKSLPKPIRFVKAKELLSKWRKKVKLTPVEVRRSAFYSYVRKAGYISKWKIGTVFYRSEALGGFTAIKGTIQQQRGFLCLNLKGEALEIRRMLLYFLESSVSPRTRGELRYLQYTGANRFGPGSAASKRFSPPPS